MLKQRIVPSNKEKKAPIDVVYDLSNVPYFCLLETWRPKVRFPLQEDFETPLKDHIHPYHSFSDLLSVLILDIDTIFSN